MKKNGKVLVLGLDGMEPYTTKRMVEAGKMPNVKKLLDLGAAREDFRAVGCYANNYASTVDYTGLWMLSQFARGNRFLEPRSGRVRYHYLWS